MPVIRKEKTDNFTVIANEFLRDRELSLKAKGLLALMLSLPETWRFSVRGLAGIVKESVGTVSRILNELEERGYLQREREEKSIGSTMVYTLCETLPIVDNSVDNSQKCIHFRCIENSDIENGYIENSDIENESLINKEESIKEEEKKEETSTHRSSAPAGACQRTQTPEPAPASRGEGPAAAMGRPAPAAPAAPPDGSIGPLCPTGINPCPDGTARTAGDESPLQGFLMGRDPGEALSQKSFPSPETPPPSLTAPKSPPAASRPRAPTSTPDEWYKVLWANLEADTISCDNRMTRARIHELVSVAAEAAASRRPTRIAGRDVAPHALRQRLLALNSAHLQYVLDSLERTAAPVRNMRAYLLTCLWNAPLTMENYYDLSLREYETV